MGEDEKESWRQKLGEVQGAAHSDASQRPASLKWVGKTFPVPRHPARRLGTSCEDSKSLFVPVTSQQLTDGKRGRVLDLLTLALLNSLSLCARGGDRKR